MPEHHPQPADVNDRSSQFDRILDETLAKYSAVEPRPGLEGRILANLHNERARPDRTRLQWGLAVAVAATVVVVVALGWKSNRVSHPAIANHPAAITLGVPSPGTSAAHAASPSSPFASGRVPVRKRIGGRAHATEAAAANPKLDQFPSPHPMSEQEKALARYVAQFQDEAVLMARARTAASKRELEDESNEAESGQNEDSVAR